MSKPRNIFVEFHVLTSHAPSNLNRDDLGTPKTAVFGDARRLRISSQCLKRTWRWSPWFRDALGDELLATRTKRFPEQILARLRELGAPSAGAEAFVQLFSGIGKKAKGGKDEADEGTDEAELLAAEPEAAGLAPAGKAFEAPKTNHLLFLSDAEINALVLLGVKFAPELEALARQAAEKDAKGKPGKSAKAAEKELLKKREAIFSQIQGALEAAAPTKAADIALFGRFVTSEEIDNVDAALQVAHALGTGKVELETDFFTAVDDRKPKETTGSAHMGDTEFASAVFYKYACCNLGLLLEHFGGNAETAARTFRALIPAMARAVPLGKKNGTAAENPADYVSVTIRRDAPLSLANAFLKPVRAKGASDSMAQSIQELRTYSAKIDEGYGTDDVVARRTWNLRKEAGKEESLAKEQSDSSLKGLIDAVARLVVEQAASLARA